MLELSISPRSGVPLVEQIVSAVRRQIDDQVLRPGCRLPPIRQLAEMYEVSRFTVVEAYERLVAQGYLRSRRGSGFYVAHRESLSKPSALPLPEMDQAINEASLMRLALGVGTEGLRVSAGWLPTSWFDQTEICRQMRAMLRNEALNLTDYNRPEGYEPLRQYLVRRLEEQGIASQSSQILLTLGATQALDFAARHFVRSDDIVFVDDPGYATLFGNLRLHGARLIGIPWTPEGPDAAELERLAALHKPKVYFTQSVLHNPTGACLSPANAHRILQCAERHDFYIVEDDTYCDFYAGSATRLASLDQLDRVIYISSFSKTLSGNLRVGYVTARPDILTALTNIKVLSTLSTPAASEELVYRMLTEGYYRKHIERLRTRLGEATARTLRMTEQLGLSPFVVPRGGLFMFLRLPGVEDAMNLAALAAQQNINLAPGCLFRPQNQASSWLRLNVVYGHDVRLERFLDELLSGRRTQRQDSA